MSVALKPLPPGGAVGRSCEVAAVPSVLLVVLPAGAGALRGAMLAGDPGCMTGAAGAITGGGAAGGGGGATRG